MELVSLIFCLRQQTTLNVGDQFKWEICHCRTARMPNMCEGRRLCGIHVNHRQKDSTLLFKFNIPSSDLVFEDIRQVALFAVF